MDPHELDELPGATEFLAFCEEQAVEVFYVTNRDQGEETFDYALRQLQYLDLPFADADHLTVYRETSDKSSSREAIENSRGGRAARR